MGHDSATCLSCRAFRPCEVLAREASAVLPCQWCLNGECPRHPRTGNEEPATPPAAERVESKGDGSLWKCPNKNHDTPSNRYRGDPTPSKWCPDCEHALRVALEAELREAKSEAEHQAMLASDALAMADMDLGATREKLDAAEVAALTMQRDAEHADAVSSSLGRMKLLGENIALTAERDAARALLGEARAVLEAFANQRSIIRHGENAIVARDLVRRIGEATKVVG